VIRTEQDLAICCAMSIDPAKLAAHRGVAAHAELALYSGALSQEHLRTLCITGQDEAKLREELARKQERERLEKSLSAQDLAICRAMGIDAKKLAAMRGKTAHAAQTGTAGLTHLELQVCREFGVDPAKYAALKSKGALAAKPADMPAEPDDLSGRESQRRPRHR